MIASTKDNADFRQFHEGYEAAAIQAIAPDVTLYLLPDSRTHMRLDCLAFFDANAALLKQASVMSNYSFRQAGADFLNTRLGQGGWFFAHRVPLSESVRLGLLSAVKEVPSAISLVSSESGGVLYDSVWPVDRSRHLDDLARAMASLDQLEQKVNEIKPVPYADQRERLMGQALTHLFSAYGCTLESDPPHINSRGEFSLALKPSGYKGPIEAAYPQELADFMTQWGNPRTGQEPGATMLGGYSAWCWMNHFDAERLLKAVTQTLELRMRPTFGSPEESLASDQAPAGAGADLPKRSDSPAP